MSDTVFEEKVYKIQNTNFIYLDNPILEEVLRYCPVFNDICIALTTIVMLSRLHFRHQIINNYISKTS